CVHFAHIRRHLIGHHHYSLVFCMDTFFPVMDGGRWYHRWKELTVDAGGFDVDNDLMNGHEALCANYTIPKEGDTMSFMHLIPNGLHNVQHPEWGNWSGRYSFNCELGMWWCDQQDTYEGNTNRDNTLKRWAVHLQNDFKTRADWCITECFNDANHEPIPHLQGDASRDVLLIDTHAGKNLVLTAEGSNDPDGNNLSYQWVYYSEASTYKGEVTIEDSNKVNCIIKIPPDAVEKTVHIILQVTDDGDVPLTRYRRAIIRIIQ
ncbi:MAG: nucleoside hydrolase-like domain-containing protein, partial [Candidatus Poribacteria bacterium]